MKRPGKITQNSVSIYLLKTVDFYNILHTEFQIYSSLATSKAPKTQPARKKRAAPAGSSSERAKRPKGLTHRRRRSTDGLTPSELALDDVDSDVDQRAATRSRPSAPSEHSNTMLLATDLASGPASQTSKPAPRTKSKIPKAYLPGFRTGGWGILVALYLAHRPGSPRSDLTKEEIIFEAQNYCNSSYTESRSREGGAGNNGFYTAWNMLVAVPQWNFVEFFSTTLFETKLTMLCCFLGQS